MVLNIGIQDRLLYLTHSHAGLGRTVQIVAEDTCPLQLFYDLVVAAFHIFLNTVLLCEYVANEGRNAISDAGVSVMHGNLTKDKLGGLVNFLLIQQKRDVNDDEDDVAVFEVVVCRDFCSHKRTRGVDAMYTHWLQVLVPTLIGRVDFESHRGRLGNLILLTVLTAYDGVKELSFARLGWANKQHITAIHMLKLL